MTLTTTGPGVRLLLWVVACVLCSIGAVIVVGRLWHLLSIVAVCLVLACCLEPGVQWLHKRGLNRSAAAAVVVLGTVAAIASVIGAVGTMVTSQALSLVDQIPDLLDQVTRWADRYGVQFDTTRGVTWASDFGQGLLERTFTGFLTTITGLLLVYFILADGHRLRRTICSTLPPARQATVLGVWEIAIDRAGRYLAVRVILAALSSLFTLVVLEALSTPNAIALAIWVGVVSQMIPVLGTYLAMALPLLVAAVDGSARDAVIIAIALVAYQQVENFYLSPKLSGRALDVHPAVAFLGVLAGSGLLGPAGAVIALPVLATGAAVISTYIHRHELITDALLGNHEQPRAEQDPACPTEDTPSP